MDTYVKIWIGVCFLKTYSILFILIAIMHLITLVNVILFEGACNGLVVSLSNVLFIIACVYVGIERRGHKKGIHNT